MPLATPTARGTPVGRQMEDGYQTLVTFNSNPTLAIWEKGVKPFGWDGGEAIPTSTMHNLALRTKASRALIDSTPLTIRAAYDPRAYTAIKALVNVNQQINQWLPDGSAVAFYGFLKSFMPDEHTEGKDPEATIVVEVTNTDPTTGAEVSPVRYPASGTGT